MTPGTHAAVIGWQRAHAVLAIASNDGPLVGRGDLRKALLQ